MGYSTPSYPVQVLGPNPTRAPSEKFVRKMERALGLPAGSLDAPRPDAAADAASVTPVSPAAAPARAEDQGLDAELLSRVVGLVLRTAAEEKANLSHDKLASLITIGYEDARENSGTVRESSCTSSCSCSNETVGDRI